MFDEFVGAGIEPARILEAMFGQTAGVQRRPRREAARDQGTAVSGEAAPGLRIDAAQVAGWRPAASAQNPLRTPGPHVESPVRTRKTKPVETIEKPPAPHVPHIRIVEFGADDIRTSDLTRSGNGGSPLRHHRGGG